MAAKLGEANWITQEELQLAVRNHGMPLEALRYPITPVGLHYLLIHFDIPPVDARLWRLEVTGRVRQPLALSLDDVKALGRTTVVVTMECAGNGRARLDPRPVGQPWINEAVGTAEWTGAPVAALLEQAGLEDDATEVVFTGLDRGVEAGVEMAYQRSLACAELRRREVLLVYEMNGVPLPPQHGAPLRLVVPGWYGMTNVKWLTHIEAVAEPFTGYQQVTAYRLRQHEDDEGTPVERMRPRSLILPPGIPDLFSRRRFVAEGPLTLAGRAWSGFAPVASVVVSTDGGQSWAPADLDSPALGPWAWRGWRYRWTPAGPGLHTLRSRACDEAGNEQAADSTWNLGGYCNADPQEVLVQVGATAPS